MTEETIADRIRLSVYICFRCMRRGQLRRFSGYQVGKRRDRERFPAIAREIGAHLSQSLEFHRNGEKVGPDSLVPPIAGVLNGVPDEDAFSLCTRNFDLAHRTLEVIGQQTADALLTAFEISRRPPPKLAVVTGGNTESAADCALSYLHRLGELVPRYKWRRANGPHMADFFGYEGGIKFGRIWQDYSAGLQERWHWTCLVTMNRILNSPSSGSADIARQAARDVEDYYDALKRLNGLAE